MSDVVEFPAKDLPANGAPANDGPAPERLASILPGLKGRMRFADPRPARGRVKRILGVVAHASVPSVSIGELCLLRDPRTGREVAAEVVGFVEDEALLDYLGEHGIGIECNLTSNVQTSTVPDYASHPLRAYLERGLLATINTDDPGISGIDLSFEYEVAAPAAGLTPELIAQARRNSAAMLF